MGWRHPLRWKELRWTHFTPLFTYDQPPGELQHARIECAQRCQAFEALQATLGRAEAEGAAQQMVMLEAEERVSLCVRVWVWVGVFT